MSHDARAEWWSDAYTSTPEVSLRLWPTILLLSCSPEFTPIVTDEGTDSSDDVEGFDGRRIAPGMIAFYEAEACPEGWSVWEEATGRALVGANGRGGVGTTTGDALEAHQPRGHTHGVTGSAVVGSAGLAGIQGCCTSSPGEHGTFAITASGDERDNRMPTIALQVCMKDGDVGYSPSEDLFPSGATAFFARPACPSGWDVVEDGKGRLVVGLGMFGDPMQTVGTALEDGEERMHGHSVAGTVSVPVASIAGSSGGTTYGASGSHPVTGTSDEAGSGLPYAQALLCGRL